MRSCAEHALRRLVLRRSLFGFAAAALLCCSALRGSFPLSGLAATTKMAALKYLTPLSMLRKYFAKASYNNNNSEKENGVKFKMIANAEQTKMMMKMKILRGAAEGSSRRCCV